MLCVRNSGEKRSFIEFEPYPCIILPGLAVANYEIHIWSARVDVHTSLVERLYCMLSPGERERADRFRFQNDRRRYIASHALLCHVLSVYRDEEAHVLRYRFGANGKPHVQGGPEFNMSHSGDLALVAVGGQRRVGVDVEALRVVDDAERIAARYFTAAERDALYRLPRKARPRAFLLCWTRKEAYVKALGDGLSMPLDAFQVTLAPGGSPQLWKTRGRPAERIDFSLYHLEPSPGYVGALAAQGMIGRVRARSLSLESVLTR